MTPQTYNYFFSYTTIILVFNQTTSMVQGDKDWFLTEFFPLAGKPTGNLGFAQK